MATWADEKSALSQAAGGKKDQFVTRFQRTLSDHVFGDELRRMDDMAHGGNTIRMSVADVPEEIMQMRKDPFMQSDVTPSAAGAGYVGPDPAAAEAKDVIDFPKAPESGLTTAEANVLFKKWGPNGLEEKQIPLWVQFGTLLIQPMPIMLWVAAFVEMGIQNWPDAGILLGIQFANAGIAFYETTKSGNAVAALKNSLKPTCACKRDGIWHNKFDGTKLVPGDLVQLYQGGAVPADVWVNHGEIDIDQSAMTGESLPVTMYEGDIAKLGSTVARGEVEATVQSTGMNTFFGKTAQLLQAPKERSNLDQLLLDIMIVLVALSFLLCIIVFIRLLQIEGNFIDALSFTVVLIVASIPLAMEIVTTTTLAMGSKELSKFGAIVSRLGAIEDLAGMNVLCSDKTGTLTKNKMEIQEDTPTFYPKINQKELLRYAAMAAKWEDAPKDALDTLVLGPTGADLDALGQVTQIDYMPFDPRVKRTESTIKVNATEEVFKVTKGAPNVLLALCDDRKVVRQVNHTVNKLAKDGIRSLAVARTIDNDINKWVMLGLITFLDPPRDDTKETVRRSLEYGVPVRMITGDHVNIARKTARDLGLQHPDNIKGPDDLPVLVDGEPPDNMLENYEHVIRSASGFASVFPEHKYLIVEIYRLMGFKVGMTGDGVNDAPALKRADVGVAVQGATDAANAASDIVLTREGLSTIVDSMVIARQIFQRMKNFLIYRIAATLQLLVFFFIAVLAMRPQRYADKICDFKAIAGTPEGGICQNTDHDMSAKEYNEFPVAFHMPVLLLMLITLLNDGTLIAIGYDNVSPSPRPEVWNLKMLFLISSLLAGVACVSSLWLLHETLNSWQDGTFLRAFGVQNLTYGQITMSIYLKVSISDFLTLFSCRAGEGFFWTSRPAPILLYAGMTSLAISTIIASTFPVGSIDDTAVAGLALVDPRGMMVFVWVYCLVWFVIQDVCKVLCYKWMHKYNIFDIKNRKQAQDFQGIMDAGDDNAHMGREIHSMSIESSGGVEDPARWGKEPLKVPLLG